MKQELIDYQIEWEEPGAKEKVREIVQSSKKKIVVLDDDPTGSQTVHGVSILTEWTKEELKKAFLSNEPLFFILTNSRSLTSSQTEILHKEIATHLCEVSREEAIPFTLISRSDSTMRGHYPIETDVLAKTMQDEQSENYDAHFIIPAFFEAGRMTFEDVHYIVQDDKWTPVNKTEFANDKTFGYSNGNLKRWVVEKTSGDYRLEDCKAISIDLLRKGSKEIESFLEGLENNTPVIVNALSYGDLDVFSLAVHRAENRGKRFLYRTAASFVKSYSGIPNKDYLSYSDIFQSTPKQKGGLIIVGSHVNVSTLQLNALISKVPVKSFEINVGQLLDSSTAKTYLEKLVEEINKSIEHGDTTVIYSSRELISAKDKVQSLQISKKISNYIVQLVRSIEAEPRYIIAKGGITSSDIATDALDIKQAMILGQIVPGVSVWITNNNSKYPYIPYIVFPGNVGEEDTLIGIVDILENRKK
ncbi:uncharacterized protein YgbK (DUF1537 family) [Salirhabdus euzebyi]|uniref:Uncharacterized protein YgbK (DUF1537 family) n=1 Tax=Salirhabdus euzebyi TaxID=394506 RepID=A0A841Q869_9BACI|nr:four-carbon acid sugar kinase family protein [Salirhabdus euzebyi]MBB6454598.1 uncharacterized protein YgbK (DUF1537 family) [Salirhabdus euzebyi]